MKTALESLNKGVLKNFVEKYVREWKKMETFCYLCRIA